MAKLLLYIAAIISALVTLRAPNILTLGMFFCCAGLLYLNRNSQDDVMNALLPEAMTDVAYNAALEIPERFKTLIEKIIFIDGLYREEKVIKSKATFYEHILPKLIHFHEKEKQLSEIPKTKEELSLEHLDKNELVYQAVEDWCDERIKAYKENLSLNADIDKDVIIKLTKYL